MYCIETFIFDGILFNYFDGRSTGSVTVLSESRRASPTRGGAVGEKRRCEVRLGHGRPLPAGRRPPATAGRRRPLAHPPAAFSSCHHQTMSMSGRCVGACGCVGCVVVRPGVRPWQREKESASWSSLGDVGGHERDLAPRTNPALSIPSAFSSVTLLFVNPLRVLGPGRIAVLGDTAVGKTALCLALTSGTHPPPTPAASPWPLPPGGGDPPPLIFPPGGTVGAAIHMFVMPHPTSGAPILVELFDLSGSPVHEDGRRSLLRATPLHAVWLVHDVTWPASRAALRRRWLPELLAARSPSSAGGLPRDDLAAAWRLLRRRRDGAAAAGVGWAVVAAARRALSDWGVWPDEEADAEGERRLLAEVRLPVAVIATKADGGGRGEGGGGGSGSRGGGPKGGRPSAAANGVGGVGGVTSVVTCAASVGSSAPLVEFVQSIVARNTKGTVGAGGGGILSAASSVGSSMAVADGGEGHASWRGGSAVAHPSLSSSTSMVGGGGVGRARPRPSSSHGAHRVIPL